MFCVSVKKMERSCGPVPAEELTQFVNEKIRHFKSKLKDVCKCDTNKVDTYFPTDTLEESKSNANLEMLVAMMRTYSYMNNDVMGSYIISYLQGDISTYKEVTDYIQFLRDLSTIS